MRPGYRVRAASAPGTVPGSSPFRLRHLVALVAAGLGLVAALLAGLWGLGTARGSDDDHPPSGWVVVEDGWVRVEGVTDRTVSHVRMPGMQTMPDADPVPSGHTRYLVQLSVAAGNEPLRWDGGDVAVSGSDMRPTPPHGIDLGDGVVPAGSTVSGSVTVDVPEGAERLVLRFADGRIPLPAASAAAEHSSPGHGPEVADHHRDDPH